ncbi:glycosyltransferase family 39 protein [Nocardia pseudobrasiliensis]|uniref:4-amino-4-deoxy-L-arabinose transferase-like glycosyltransferase n=1 Tax=Nocardia pseudobrasiliensis TaxID=45979 RepID=A0A370HMG6_9NOCA|nr:glycosyltransferase family 39 protein [Nocardia pseudobrasiliensis]RDI59698.1 4-amino-4-deoxy-L-arabinose transferase-like glycosyltransferase [Nocardia pseudobrasiliensis]
MTATALGPSAAVDGPPSHPGRVRWEYVALAALLLGTTIAYLCNLSANGWANAFYAAAAQAGSVSCKAFLFGSSDGGNAITVDKTPASLWPMALSIRLFGLNSWSLLLPQVLMGVGAVALVWATVRRTFGGAAGLLAGLALALTPVAALMFRFDNPDALLVLMMAAAAWAMTRAVEDGRTRWLVLCGLFVGLGFLAKQLQVMLVVPALALTYLIAGPPGLGKRVPQLLAAGLGVLVGAGWWVLIAELWPTDSRPYFGGSPHNSILELTLGYNGLGRLNGDEFNGGGPGGPSPRGGGGWFSEGVGITRLFQPGQGGQIAWLIPAALILCVAGIFLCGRAARTDRHRAGFLLWGGWLLVTGLVFSFMKGIFHQYYTVALSPAIAALFGAGAITLWHNRDKRWVRATAALTMALTTATAWLLLSRTAAFLPWLRWTILIAGIATTLALLLPTSKRAATATAAAALTVGLAGPLAYTVETLTLSHAGPIPIAGPKVPMHFGGPGMPPGPGGQPGPSGYAGPSGQPAPSGPGGQSDSTDHPGPGGPQRQPGSGGQAEPGQLGPSGQSGSSAPYGPGGQPDPQRQQSPGGQPEPGGRLGPGGAAGFMMGGPPNAEVVRLLAGGGGGYTWVAATVGSMSAAPFQLATQLPVMPVGGFSGHDPSPSLERFQRYVSEGRIHYFIAGRERGPAGRAEESDAARISAWVEGEFTARDIDGVRVYDLTQHR